jgi:DNA-binding transcriptional ArsR family regulator
MPTELNARQRLSKIWFGQVHRLDVMIAIDDSTNGCVNPTQLAELLGMQQSALQAPLRDLLAGGAIEYVDVQQRRNIYRKVEDDLVWPWVKQLEAQARRLEKERGASNVRKLKGSS